MPTEAEKTVVDREGLLVELVNPDGIAVGACTVAEAHAEPGLRHRAFSVLLYDRAGRVLLQRRAEAKTRFPGRWSNTCCGHPSPNEPVVRAAATRLSEELGVTAPLTEIGVYCYRAHDPDSEYVEHEWDHVLVGLLEATPSPDPAEVAEWAWAETRLLRQSLRSDPGYYTPWLRGVLDLAITCRELPTPHARRP
ncbi:MAG: isopentenyl-diphosphate Delta-isomerase [Mycobacteriaceae bacterium]|nr:isopentenyl-diphosphate Delta-isomerase [Mycobacteriaceae bacterium]